VARIHQPMQRKGDGRWDYTVSSDEEGWAHPDGYCAGWPFHGVTPQFVPAQEWQRAAAAALPFRAKYHTDGHATAEEAVRCHQEYELDRELRVFTRTDEQRRCVECNTWTARVVEVGTFRRWHICEGHDARATAAAQIAKGCP
jgi:hypothetical protein